MTMTAPLTSRPAFALRTQHGSGLARPATAGVRPRRVAARAGLDTSIVISGATAASLALGRFVFLPFQRDNVNRQGLGKQNNQTHPEAGDRFSQEASFALKSNDPAGFNAVDLLAWGAIGHAIGYLVLATTSLNNAGFNPKPF